MQIISLATHCGTHIDVPAHFFRDGATVDTIPLSQLVGPAFVLDVTGRGDGERIHWEDIAKHEDVVRRAASCGGNLLFRTGWSQFWGTQRYFDHPFLDGDVARKLVELGVKTLGIDAMSPDKTTVGSDSAWDFTVHNTVLKAGLVIAENLTNLDQIQTGSWIVSVTPLKIAGGDGSPVRAYAVRIGE